MTALYLRRLDMDRRVANALDMDFRVLDRLIFLRLAFANEVDRCDKRFAARSS
jgi:hypothetical protein